MKNDSHEWSTDQVGCWLEEKGFAKYRKLLCDEHLIDGKALFLLTESDLKQPPVSMKILGDIKRIVFEIDVLKKEYTDNQSISEMLLEGQNTCGNERQIDNCEAIQRHLSHSTPLPSSSSTSRRQTSPDLLDLNSSFGESHISTSTFLEPEFTKLLISTVYLMFVLLLTTYTMVVVHDWVPNMDRYPPLPDIALDKIPYIPWAFEACEVTTLIMGTILTVILLFHKHRFIIIRRLFALSGTVFVLRCITMMITSLSVPGSHLQCEPRPLGDFSTRLEMALTIYSGFGMSIKGVRTCGDYMFSGHTVVVTMFNFFITEYTPRRLYWLHIFSWVANFFAVFFILAAHEHYSIDVFVAFYITTRLFLYYHSLANNQVLSQKDSRTRVWFPMFSYFESSLNGSVPNVYELPWVAFWNFSAKKIQKLSNILKDFEENIFKKPTGAQVKNPLASDLVLLKSNYSKVQLVKGQSKNMSSHEHTKKRQHVHS